MNWHLVQIFVTRGGLVWRVLNGKLELCIFCQFAISGQLACKYDTFLNGLLDAESSMFLYLIWLCILCMCMVFMYKGCSCQRATLILLPIQCWSQVLFIFFSVRNVMFLLMIQYCGEMWLKHCALNVYLILKSFKEPLNQIETLWFKRKPLHSVYTQLILKKEFHFDCGHKFLKEHRNFPFCPKIPFGGLPHIEQLLCVISDANL